MLVRPFTPADTAACLAIFDGNAPPYFDPAERAEFEEFLTLPICHYLVIEDSQRRIIACGGYYINTAERWAGLCWGMVAREHQGEKIGSYLLLLRLHDICRRGTADRVKIDTSQHTAGFFEKLGFVVDQVIHDRYAPGLHAFEMHLKLDHGRCGHIRHELEHYA